MFAAEIHDLTLGQGEWKNMQQIIRKTFKLCLEKQYEQSQQIHNLNNQITKLKEDLSQRPTWADVENMVMLKTTHDKHMASFRSKQGTQGTSSSSSVGEIEDLKLQVMQLKSECERRVTIQSMQTALNRKADRSDVQTLRESSNKVADAPQDLSRLKLDIAEVKSELENFSEQLEETKRALGAKNTIVDLSVVKVQLEGLFRRVHEEMYDKEEVNSLLSHKVSRTDAEKMIATKSDAQALSTMSTKIEDILAEHERIITSLRLSVSDPSLFSADFLSKRGPILPVPDTTTNVSSRAHTHTSSSSSSNSNSSHLSDHKQHHTLNNSSPTRSSFQRKAATPSVNAVRSGIQDSKLESILSGLWNKMNVLVKEYKHMKDEHTQMRKDVHSMKEKLEKVAAVEKMELLAVVVEEQRLRLDAVIQGSTKIYPIFKELKRMDASLKEIDSFLALPQPRRLHEHLQEMTSLMEDLSQRLVELSADVHTQQANKVDTLMSRTDAIEARVESCLVDRERIGYLMEQVDTTDTRYSNLRDIAQGLTELWNLLLNDNTNFSVSSSHSSGNGNGRSVLSRVKHMEEQLRINDNDHTTLKHRIELLKDALSSYGMQVDQYQPHVLPSPLVAASSTRQKQQLQQSKSTNRNNGTTSGKTKETKKEKRGGSSSPSRMQMSDFDDVEDHERDDDEEKRDNATRKATSNTKQQETQQHNNNKVRRPTVDFDAAITSLYASLEDVAMPIRVPVASPLRHRMMGFIPSSHHQHHHQGRNNNNNTSFSPPSPILPDNPDRQTAHHLTSSNDEQDNQSNRSSSSSHSTSPRSEVMLMSITEVDERLAELQREKQRLRQLLINRV